MKKTSKFFQLFIRLNLVVKKYWNIPMKWKTICIDSISIIEFGMDAFDRSVKVKVIMNHGHFLHVHFNAKLKMIVGSLFRVSNRLIFDMHLDLWSRARVSRLIQIKWKFSYQKCLLFSLKTIEQTFEEVNHIIWLSLEFSLCLESWLRTSNLKFTSSNQRNNNRVNKENKW